MNDKPLGLPQGSIRAIITIGVVASALYTVIMGLELPEWYTTIVAAVVAFYYGTRSGESNPEC